jgi:hypothetical protein
MTLLLALLLAPATPAEGLLNAPPGLPAPDLSHRPVPVVHPLPPLPALAPRSELLVLTTDRLAADSRVLPRFLAFRAAEGWAVDLATEADWDEPTGQDGDSRQDRIRAYLQERYASSPGAYLLLIGDPDPEQGDLPMLNSYPVEALTRYYPDSTAENMSPTPTDFYYAELSAEWDCDGDGLPWDYPDDAECMDSQPELFVGRLPVYGGDAEALDALLERILARDLEADKSYRHRVLLPAALFGVAGGSSATGGDYPEHQDGAGVLEAIYDDLPAPFQAQALRLFEGEGLLPSPYERDLDLSRDTVVEQWSLGAGLVVWAGHGWYDSVHRVVWNGDHDGDGEGDDDEISSPAFLESSDAPDLVDAGGAFTWHISCDNAWPEDPGNLGLALLSGGAAATMAATRVSYGTTGEFGEPFEPRPDLAGGSTASTYYARWLAEGATVGEAAMWTKSELPGDGWGKVYEEVDCTGFAWATRAEFVLYGDPTRSLELCEVDDDCDDGNACTGLETCSEGFCVHSSVPDCAHLDSDCSAGLCDPEQGACVAVPLRDGASCDDGAWCTEGDACSDGVCGGEPRDCGSREGWEAVCDEVADACEWSALDTGEPQDEDEGGLFGCASRAGAAGWLLGLLGVGAVARRRGSGTI